MLRKQPAENGRVRVTFRLPAVVAVEQGHVAGDFNDWEARATPMVRDDEDLVATAELEPGRRYRFRYLLDGSRWINDWTADDYAANPHGGEDSVLDLTVRHHPTRSKKTSDGTGSSTGSSRTSWCSPSPT